MNIFAITMWIKLYALVEGAKGRLENRDETGAAAVEYGLLVALIAAVIVATVALLGTEIKEAFKTIVNTLPGGTPAS